MQKIKLICENNLWRESFLSYVRASGARVYFSCREDAEYDGVLIFSQDMKSVEVSKSIKEFNMPIFVVGDESFAIRTLSPIIFLPLDTSLRKIVSAISLFFSADTNVQTKKEIELKDEELIISSFLKGGFSNKEISLRSNIPVSSVKYYLRSIYKKLEVTNRYQAISKLQELDL